MKKILLPLLLLFQFNAFAHCYYKYTQANKAAKIDFKGVSTNSTGMLMINYSGPKKIKEITIAHRARKMMNLIEEAQLYITLGTVRRKGALDKLTGPFNKLIKITKGESYRKNMALKILELNENDELCPNGAETSFKDVEKMVINGDLILF